MSDDSVNQHTQHKVVFSSKSLSLDLRYAVEDLNGGALPSVDFGVMDLRGQGHLGLSVYSEFTLIEGQAVTFILRLPPRSDVPTQVNG